MLVRRNKIGIDSLHKHRISPDLEVFLFATVDAIQAKSVRWCQYRLNVHVSRAVLKTGSGPQ